MLQFDEHGLLKPYTRIPATLDDVAGIFADNELRKRLFENLIWYLEQVRDLCSGQQFVAWLNGSCLTKKQVPDDVDLVLFIDQFLVSKAEAQFQSLIATELYDRYQIDSYIVKVFHGGHARYNHYISDRTYWLHQFSKTKPNRSYPKGLSKGFLEIVF